ncbi:transposon Tf2-12 polyprotein [Trichonephila clavata]|uniref:RNA-directed DNA polymerase n=1 Tax=Trichonephila clavata TaxID=2740835 RepID=A0A8X6F3G0_TRICU|nr:transposon Tf2-12 polyprotein [Trichonephila clavata]
MRLSENCVFAMVDILNAKESEEESKTHVRAIFQKLNEYGLTINVSKCVFGVPEISFLGHLLTKNGTKPLPDKVDPILNYPQPKTIKELRRFLGLLNFFRRFLPRAAHNQTHLNDFLKGLKRNDKRKINWSEQAKNEFQNCKALLANATLLVHPNPNANLVL